MSLLKHSALALALGTAAGCGPDAAEAAPPAAEIQEVTSTLTAAASIDKLRALQVFEVGELILKNPSELYACYSLPCPGTDAARQAHRVATLATKAVAAAAKAAPAGACADGQIDANLTALRALKILKVGDLIREKPANNPRCYNLPCTEDIEKAKAVTCERASKLANIASDSKGL